MTICFKTRVFCTNLFSRAIVFQFWALMGRFPDYIHTIHAVSSIRNSSFLSTSLCSLCFPEFFRLCSLIVPYINSPQFLLNQLIVWERRLFSNTNLEPMCPEFWCSESRSFLIYFWEVLGPIWRGLGPLENSCFNYRSWCSLWFSKFQLIVPYTVFLIYETACTVKHESE